MTDDQRLVQLLRERSVRTGHFVLASGKTSDLYVDVRATSLDSEGCWLIGRVLLARLRSDVVGVGGLTLGADPLACATATLAWGSGRPIHAFLIRKESKGHGTNQYVEGLTSLPPGSRVAVVEDTTTTGGSLLRAIVRARDAGLDVVQTITLVDREEGAREALADAGFTLEAFTTRSALVGP